MSEPRKNGNAVQTGDNEGHTAVVVSFGARKSRLVFNPNKQRGGAPFR